MATSLVAGFFAYIHSVKRQTYLLLWTAGWCLLALHYLGSAFAGIPGDASFQNSLDHWLFGVAGVLFFLGAQLYAQRKPWLLPALIAVGVLVVWATANALYHLPVSVMSASGVAYIATGGIFWAESRGQETLADRLLSIVFFGWGLLGVAFAFFERTLEARHLTLHPSSSFPAAFAAILMVMALYEEEKRRIERNMLALSNLNLATSSFVGGEIHRMLSQTLNRVLGVVRLPAAALFLHQSDPQGPTSVVAAGLDDEFCRTVQQEGLDDYLVNPVARLGGLPGFRHLRDDSLTPPKKEQPTPRFQP